MIQEVVQQVEHAIRDVINSDVHTAMPGVIIAISPEEATCDVQPVGSYYCSGFEMEYPLISGVPLVITSHSDGIGFCFPVKEGDSCLLVFSEQSMSAWSTETSEAQKDERFELQNCMAIPGLTKVPIEAQAMANEEDCAVMFAGDTKIIVTEDGVKIEGDVEIEGDVGIEGDVSIDGDVGISGDCTVSGDSTVSGGLGVGRTLTVGGTASFTGNVSMGGNLDVAGNISSANWPEGSGE